MGHKFLRTDIFAFFLSAFLLGAGAILLYLNLTWSSDDAARRSIGHVIYRSRVVQRRNPSHVVWQQLNPEDPVFDADWIRTGEKGEAIIDLRDGARIELDPESLIALQLGNRMKVTPVKGSFIIRAKDQDIVLERSGRNFTVRGGSVRFFVDSLNDLDIEMETDGTARVLDEDGSLLLLPGEAFQSKNGKDRKTRREITSISPEDNAIFSYDGDEMEVEFHWKGRSGKALLEIYTDAPFRKNLRTYEIQGDARPVLELKAANYFWRVRQGDEVSPLRRLRLRRKTSPQQLLPRPGAKIRIPSDPGYVPFRWKEEENASSYFIELAKDRSFTERVAYLDVRRTGVSIPLSPGIYYWRVLTRGALPGTDSESSISSFEVFADEPSIDPGKAPQENETFRRAETEEASEPEQEPLTLLYPAGVVDMTGKKFLIFRWKGDSAERTFTLRDATGTVVFQTRVTGNTLTLTDLSVLDEGVFRWTLESAKDNAQAKFTIVLQE